MCLEQNGVPTVLELARTNDLAELSARAGVPLELLQQWHLLAQRQVSASPYRRKVVAITAVLMLGWLLIELTVAFRSFHTAPRVTPDSYAQAVELYQRKDYGGAARILDEALARGENTAALHNLRGILYRHASQLQAAISEYQEALAVDSAYAYAWRNLGNVYGDLKQTDQAITHYQKAAELKPQETGVRLILAGLWAQTGKLSEAEAEYKAAIAAAPDEIESYNELSALYRRWQKPDLAEQTLLRATEHNPQSDAALASLGRIYFDDERYAEAAKAYRRAAELNPKELSYWRQAGRAFRLTRDWDAALDVYRQIVEVDAADWEAHFYAGWVLLQKGEPFQQEAIAPLKAAVEAAPGDERNKWAYLNLARAYAAKGAERDADAALSEALRVDANFVPALIELGYLHQVRGNYAQAEEFYKQAIYADSTDPDTTLAYYNLVSL